MITWFRSFAPIDWKRVLLLGLSILAAVILGFLVFDPKTAVTIVHRTGYYWMLLCVILFGVALARGFNWEGVKAAFRDAGRPVLVIISLATIWIHVQEPHGFKVVNDEIVLVSSSQRMHERREAGAVLRGYDLGTKFTVMQGAMDKRPVLFPFLVSVIHDLTGYRAENGFLLNALLTPLFLYLLYFVVREFGSKNAALAAVLLWCTLPLFVQITNGAGFELLNLVMILTVFLLGFKYVQLRNADRLNAFCLSAVLLSQVRYESVLYVIPVALVIAYGWLLDKKVTLSWAVLCAPLLLVITPLQANVAKITPKVLQLADRPSSGGVYNISYFYDNVGSALNYFFSTDGLHANSHLLALAGVVGVSFFFLVIYRDSRKHQPVSQVAVVTRIMLCALVAQSFLMICYFWGDYSDWITVRLSLPTQLLFVLAFVYVYPELVASRHRWGALFSVCAIFIACWTVPVILKRGYVEYNQSAAYSNWAANYARSVQNKNILVVDSSSRVWSLYGIGCLSNDTLAEREEGFVYHYKAGTFERVILVQQLELVDAATGRLSATEASDFGDSFKLTTLEDIKYSPTNIVRLSRIDSIDPAALSAWAKKRLENKDKPPAPPRLGLEEQDAFMQKWRNNLP